MQKVLHRLYVWLATCSYSWYRAKKPSGYVVFLQRRIPNLAKASFLLPLRSPTVGAWMKLLLVSQWIVEFISMGENCLYCLHACLAASLHSWHRMKRLFWLSNKVRYSILKYLADPKNTAEIPKNPWFSWLVEIIALRRSACFPCTLELYSVKIRRNTAEPLTIVREVRDCQ